MFQLIPELQNVNMLLGGNHNDFKSSRTGSSDVNVRECGVPLTNCILSQALTSLWTSAMKFDAAGFF
jgi:hypothetical protein